MWKWFERKKQQKQEYFYTSLGDSGVIICFFRFVVFRQMPRFFLGRAPTPLDLPAHLLLLSCMPAAKGSNYRDSRVVYPVHPARPPQPNSISNQFTHTHTHVVLSDSPSLMHRLRFVPSLSGVNRLSFFVPGLSSYASFIFPFPYLCKPTTNRYCMLCYVVMRYG